MVSRELGSCAQTMDRPLPKDGIQRILVEFLNFNIVYKVVAVVLLAGLLRNIIFKPKKQNVFPTWATIEMALTVYIVSKGGLSQRI